MAPARAVAGASPDDLIDQHAEPQAAAYAVGTLEGIAREIANEHGLTPREADVMVLMAQGYSYQAIADELCLSLGTVQWHTKNVYRKLDVHTKQEVIAQVRAAMADACER